MRCPHCKVDFHNEATHIVLGNDREGGWKIVTIKCTACRKFIISLIKGKITPHAETENPSVNRLPKNLIDLTLIDYPNIGISNFFSSRPPSKHNIDDADVVQTTLVRPKGGIRPPCPAEVPANIAEDYHEACLVLADNPKASAALSRRCLQHLLEEVVKVKPDHLDKEIQQILDSGNLPSHIAEAIDAIRHIGNFAAHPMKSQRSGEVLPVEPEEAEWNLNVLEDLFDFYCVQPTIRQRKKEALNQKLQEVGKKKPMK